MFLKTRYGMVVLLGCVLALLPWGAFAADQAGAGNAAGRQLSQAELEQLAAPVALYPDTLLAQVLMAATYPLEVVAAARWQKENPKLQGQALDDAAKQQAWDPSVQSLLRFPQTLQMLDAKLDWTEKLGNAFLDQPQDVMNAVQRLRAKAQAKGNLSTTVQQTVRTEPASGGGSQTIIIQPAQPDVVYVPTYNPLTVYGPWPYPAYQPPVWYPPGYAVAGAVVSFGVGVAVGYSLWGYPDWHHGDVTINVNNYSHFTGGPPPPPPHGGGGGPHPGGGPPPGGGPRPGGNTWHHDPQHRGNVPYDNPHTAGQFQRPGRDGVSPAQARGNAREAFRGRTGVTPGGQAGFAGREGGQARRQEGMAGQRGGMEHRQGVRAERPAARESGNAGMAGRGSLERQARDRGRMPAFSGHSGERGNAFQHLGGQNARNELQRGFKSRETMRANPGGGFHGGGGHGGLRRR